MTPLALLLLVGAVALDLCANILLKHSDGFRRPLPGALALVLVCAAFTLLGFAVREMPVAVAYAAWGGMGIVTAALLSQRIDGTRLNASAWAGIGLMVLSVAALAG